MVRAWRTWCAFRAREVAALEAIAAALAAQRPLEAVAVRPASPAPSLPEPVVRAAERYALGDPRERAANLAAAAEWAAAGLSPLEIVRRLQVGARAA